MESKPRLHEIAKALGLSPKVIMSELAAKGHEFKTHMATVEGKAWTVLLKLYPDTEEKLKAAPPKAPSAPRKKVISSRVVTTRTKETKQKEKASKLEESQNPKQQSQQVSVIQRDQGLIGKVTMEQKVMQGGIIRRRKMEGLPPPPPPAPEPEVVAEPELEEVISVNQNEVESVAEEAVALEVTEEVSVVAEPQVQEEVVEEVSAPEVVEEKPAPQPEEVVTATVTPTPTPTPPTPPSPPSGASQDVMIEVPRPEDRGRMLSPRRRLKIVETPQLPPGYKPPVFPPRTKPAAAGTTTTPPKPGERRDIPLSRGGRPSPAKTAAEEAEIEKAKKKAASPRTGVGLDVQLTQQDLLAMTEEVEISRVYGRRFKKPGAPKEKKKNQITAASAAKRIIKIENEIQVSALADRMGIKAADVVRKLVAMGQLVGVAHMLDHDTAAIVASEYGYEVQNVAQTAESILSSARAVTDESLDELRAPVVTIMGHVDHGKTSLLDTIRKTRVAAGESGGITQHIGAYQVVHKDKRITFLDTPGHAAFSKMRARGASITDVVVLVVAGDEGVKPQTIEAIAHAKDSKAPIIVAINKMDKPDANPEKVIQELSKYELIPEDWGGETIMVKVSAKTGLGLDDLLDMILLQADVGNLRANPKSLAQGVIIESRLDVGKGPVATVLVRNGTLRRGDFLVCGDAVGRVRALFNENSKMMNEAGPSTPVEVLGFDTVPEVGGIVTSVADESLAKRASELSVDARKKAEHLKGGRQKLEDLYKKMQSGEASELRVLLKGDAHGSIEAIADSLEKIEHPKVKVKVVFKAAGGISETDVDLAAASGSIILGFHVRPTAQAKASAKQQSVQIKTYDIIYQLIDEVKLAMSGLLAPIIKESVLGQAEVREVFHVSKVGTIAGCFVKSGKILRNAQARLLRNNVVVYDGSKILSLKRFKDDARDVKEGFECGIQIENYDDLKTGDIIECYEKIEIAQAVG